MNRTIENIIQGLSRSLFGYRNSWGGGGSLSKIGIPPRGRGRAGGQFSGLGLNIDGRPDTD